MQNVIQLPTAVQSRAERDSKIASENGFALGDKLWYRIGTQADPNQDASAIEVQRRQQVSFDKKPSAHKVITKLIDWVGLEYRRDLPAIPLGMLRMTNNGRLAFTSSTGDVMRIPVTNKVFNSIFGRFSCNSGQSYLSSCPTELRSINFNHWAALTHEQDEASGKTREVVLRTRMNPGDGSRNVFAAISPRYTVFDADRIGRSLRDASPQDARGALDYNGERFRFEALWRTDVDPSEFQTGEIFKAGILVSADDTGSGSIVVRSVVWRHACKNLLIVNKAVGYEARLRHCGDERQLTTKFEDAFSQAMCSIDAFRHAWGYATSERDNRLVERVGSATHRRLPTDSNEVLPGIFNGLIERDMLSMPGDRQQAIDKLCEMHRQDEMAAAYGVSRASIINAVTRYAHTQVANPFKADAIRAEAGALLSNHKGNDPAPLPYSPVAA